MAAESSPLSALDAPSRLAAGELPAVIVFAGEETFLAEEGIAGVVEGLFPDGEPAGGIVALDPGVPADAEKIPSVLEELSTASLFGEGKLVIIRRAEGIGGAADADEEEGGEGEEDDGPDRGAAARAPKAPAAGEVEVERLDKGGGMFAAAEGAKEAGKGKPAKGPGRKVNPITGLVKQAMAAAVPGAHLVIATKKPVRGKGSVSAEAIAKTGALLVDCRRLYDAPPPWARGGSAFDTEVGAWLVKRAKRRHGKALDAKAAHALVRRLGAGLAPLARALETLVTYVGERPSVTEADVAATVGETREDPAWALADAVLDRDLDRALRLVAQAFERGLSDPKGRVHVRPEAVFPMLAVVLQNSYRRAMLVAEAAARGGNPTDLPALAGLPGFVIERLLKQVSRRDPEELLVRHAAFLEADGGVRGGGVPPRLAMERLVIALIR